MAANDLTLIQKGSNSEVALRRQWSSEPDGLNDKAIEIWHNGNWVPAYFKDLRAGDFFLNLDSKLNADQCFLAKSNCKRSVWNHIPSFMVEGIEVVTAPAMKDIEHESLGYSQTPTKLLTRSTCGDT